MKKPFDSRAYELDLLRGIAVLFMILDHFMFDLCGLLPALFTDYPRKLLVFAYNYWYWDVRTAVRIVIVFVFLALTGICCSFSRDNLKRGFKLLLVALGLTAVTFIAGEIIGESETMIVFGVLHAIAVSLLLVGLMEKLHTNKWVYLALGSALCIFAIAIELTHDVHLVSYSADKFHILFGKAVLGTIQIGSDCFALPQTCGQIFLGVFLGKQFYKERKSAFGLKYHREPVAFLGRHSLIVYFAHQVILPVLAAIVLVCLGYTLAL